MPEVPVPPEHVSGRLYAACVRGAAWLDGHRLIAGTVGAPLVVAALVAINQFVLLGFPNSGDEYANLFQARTMTAGRLWNVTPDIGGAEMFATEYVVREAGRAFSTFPPGWPFALALAARLPAWLVNPIIGAVTLALIWTLGARLYSRRVGVIAAALVAVSPFFAFNSASYFSHPLCGALVLGAACLAARNDRRPWWVPVAVGLLLGWAVVTRYFTGVVCAVPIVWWLLRPGVPRVRAVALIAVGAMPWILALAGHNVVLNGNPWRLTTTEHTVSLWFADGVLMRGADILATHVVRHLLWTPPILVVAYVLYLRAGRADLRRGLLHWLPVLMAAGLYFYMERGGNQYGARFHYEVFPFLVVFVTAHVFAAADYGALPRRDRVVFNLLVLSVAAMPVAFVTHALIERDVVRERTHPFALAAALGLHGALVLIDGRVGTRRSMAALDLTRNAPALDSPVLYGLDRGPAVRCADAARLPDRTPYLYRWDVARREGVLTPLECP